MSAHFRNRYLKTAVGHGGAQRLTRGSQIDGGRRLAETHGEAHVSQRDDVLERVEARVASLGQVVEHVDALKRDLQSLPGSLPEIALRFCLSNPAVTSVIPGMRRIATVESSCRAAAAGKLDARTLAILKDHAWDRNFYQ